MSYIPTDFPFCAVQGQGLFKKALILAAIYPAIGGVLVSGPRGCAKSTLARALAHIIPTAQSESSVVSSPFVTLPLATSLEMLTGTLDLEQVLSSQKVNFSPGLLAKADGGILYVDEVNLLADHLVDQLLDVAASGVNRVERDGVSHVHQSKFSLIGTMNPDEGELREQLIDRFGLMVELDSKMDLNQRVQIVKAREAFERDPQAFIAQFDVEQSALKQQIQQAKALLNQVQCDDQVRLYIAQCCQDAGVDGLRADIVMYRAALAHAAWQGNLAVSHHDVDQVQELVLAHRRKIGSPHNSNSSTSDEDKGDSENDNDQGKGDGDKQLPSQQNNTQSPSPSPSQSPNRQKGHFSRPDEKTSKAQDKGGSESDWGGMQAPQKTKIDSSATHHSAQTRQALEQLFSKTDQQTTYEVNHDHDAISDAKRLAKKHLKKSKGASNTDVALDIAGSGAGINWFASIVASLNKLPSLNFKYHQKQSKAQMHHLILLDTSGSTLVQQLSSTAKACVLDISKQAYLQRESIQILGFGNAQVQHLLAKVKAPKELSDMLNDVDIGGATPLRDVLEQAKETLLALSKSSKHINVRCYLITDGRSKAQVSDIVLNAPTVLIDTENSQVKRGRGLDIAQQLNAHYYALQT